MLKAFTKSQTKFFYFLLNWFKNIVSSCYTADDIWKLEKSWITVASGAKSKFTHANTHFWHKCLNVSGRIQLKDFSILIKSFFVCFPKLMNSHLRLGYIEELNVWVSQALVSCYELPMLSVTAERGMNYNILMVFDSISWKQKNRAASTFKQARFPVKKPMWIPWNQNLTDSVKGFKVWS